MNDCCFKLKSENRGHLNTKWIKMRFFVVEMEQNLVFLPIKLTLKILAFFDSATLLNLQRKQQKLFKNLTSFGSLGLSKKIKLMFL